MADSVIEAIESGNVSSLERILNTILNDNDENQCYIILNQPRQSQYLTSYKTPLTIVSHLGNSQICRCLLEAISQLNRSDNKQAIFKNSFHENDYYNWLAKQAIQNQVPILHALLSAAQNALEKSDAHTNTFKNFQSPTYNKITALLLAISSANTDRFIAKKITDNQCTHNDKLSSITPNLPGLGALIDKKILDNRLSQQAKNSSQDNEISHCNATLFPNNTSKYPSIDNIEAKVALLADYQTNEAPDPTKQIR